MKTMLPTAEELKFWMHEAFTHYGAVPYYTTPNAPSSFKELLQWAESHVLGVDALPVYDGGCDETIYDSAEANHMFRAWHDSIHIKECKGFGKQHEIDCSNVHQLCLKEVGAPQIILDTFRAEVEGQVRYYYLTKEYINDQKGFVEACLINGLDTVIDSVANGVRY